MTAIAVKPRVTEARLTATVESAPEEELKAALKITSQSPMGQTTEMPPDELGGATNELLLQSKGTMLKLVLTEPV